MTLAVQLDRTHFPYPLIVHFIDGRMWELVRSFEYIRDNGEVITVPAGFMFDFASIPRIFWSVIGSPTGPYGPAAVIHDFLCVKKPYPYPEIDYIFYEAMKNLDVPYLKRTVMYYAVCLFHLFN